MTSATVHLPGARLEQVREGTAPLGLALGVVRSGQAGDIVVLDVGAGRYEFSYEAPGLAARLRASD